MSGPFDWEQTDREIGDLLNEGLCLMCKGVGCDECNGTGYAPKTCDQCVPCMIQGVFCHETGCPNA